MRLRFQVVPPFFLAGFGTLAAGLLLDKVQVLSVATVLLLLLYQFWYIICHTIKPVKVPLATVQLIYNCMVAKKM